MEGKKSCLIKIPFFCLCIAGFTYQTTSFLLHYWTYPSVVNIQVVKPITFDMPAVTMCNLNSVRVSAVCKKFPELCEKPENETIFCLSHPHNCEDGKVHENFLVVKDVKKLITLSREDSKELGHQPEDMIILCEIYFETYVENCKESFQFIQTTNTYSGSVNCFTFFSSLNQPDKIPEKLNTYSVIQFKINLEGHEYLPNSYALGITLSVHSPYTILSPYRGGEPLDIRSINFISLSQVQRRLLPPPFESNCTDYRGKWKERNGNGPVTKEMCIQECALNMTLKKHGCADVRIFYPHFEKICEKKLLNFSSLFIEPCSDMCYPECLSDEYKMEIRTAEFPIPEGACEDLSTAPKQCNMMTIILRFNKMETTVSTFSPKYERIEILSYIGGYVGIWLGMSLFDVFIRCQPFVKQLRLKNGHSKKCCCCFRKQNQSSFRRAEKKLRRRIIYY